MISPRLGPVDGTARGPDVAAPPQPSLVAAARLHLLTWGEAIGYPLGFLTVGVVLSLVATSLQPVAPGTELSPWLVLPSIVLLVVTHLGWPLAAFATGRMLALATSRGTELAVTLGLSRHRCYRATAGLAIVVSLTYAVFAALVLAVDRVVPGSRVSATVGWVWGVERTDTSLTFSSAAELSLVRVASCGTVVLLSAATGMVGGVLWRRWRTSGLVAAGIVIVGGTALLVAAVGAVDLATVGPSATATPEPTLPGPQLPLALATISAALVTIGYLLLERPERPATAAESTRLPRTPLPAATDGPSGGPGRSAMADR